MKYGYFNDQTKEYIITNPKTPVKWINYIGGLSFGGLIDQTGGSLICKGDPAVNRIIKYIPQLPASSFNGETAYIRLHTKKGYRLISPFYTPTLSHYQDYECRVGMGYSIYRSIIDKIETKIRVFVPQDSQRVIRDVTITNHTKESLDLDYIPLVEYSHFEALKQFNNADWVPQTMMSNVYRHGDKTILMQYAFMKQNSGINYLTSNAYVSSFETDKNLFLGDNGFGTFLNPLSLQKEELSNTIVKRGDNIGALLHPIKDLKPGQSRRIITQLGQCASLEKDLEEITYYYEPSNVDKAFLQVKDKWDHILSHMIVDTPNKEMNSMLNVFNPRQCNTTLNWSRYLSLYQLGLGARGIGFRDSSQDVMGVIGQSPKEAKALLIKLLSMQKRDGSAMHQFNPVTMIGNEGDSREEESRDHFYGDDHLWIILAVTAYLKETGDMDFLDSVIAFYDKNKQDYPIEEASVLDHLKRALHFTKNHTGYYGLPLLGFADWNDTVNLPKGAESMFIANLYGTALQEMISLCETLKNDDLKDQYTTDYIAMKQIVNTVGWDKDWYIRYFDENHKPLGSYKNDFGKIYVNAQSWSVISGFATKEKTKKALDSVYKYLNTEKGIKLSYPSYDTYDPSIGGITTYPKGAKENGGIFLHSNPWAMIAETINGNGNRAFQYYNQINPATKNDSIDEFECEPYVYPQNILGDEHPQFGLARNSWLSGTASWMYQAATQYILGIKPTYDGLSINPCIPSDWDGFTVTRQFQGATYHIKIDNTKHVQKGVTSIVLDGITLESNTIPSFKDGKDHCVKVVLG
jgi:cellobiose phosphorylase